jgi:putative flavoprotein involved in K+ transport
MELIDTVVIGAGQAGLATSYWLQQSGVEHVVMERASRPASTWRNNRWDSFTMVTPNWTFRLPAADYTGDDPDGYMPRDQIVEFFDRYVERFSLPVQCQTEVVSVESQGSRGFHVTTPAQSFTSRNVIVATGFFQHARVPSFAPEIPQDAMQLVSGDYRNPDALPAGAVLVVGSGQAGCQIAEELYLAGRTVYQSIGGTGRAPRRYRGKDIITWLDMVGFFDTTPDHLPPGMGKFGSIPHVSGTKGGHSLNLHQFARDGVRLLGRIESIAGGVVEFVPNVHENLTRADQFEKNATSLIDEFIASKGLDVPAEELPRLQDGFAQPIVDRIDLKQAGIGSVIWATGYRFDYGFLKMQVLDDDGFPIQQRGIAEIPGLYFVGMPWMPTERSGFLMGVGDCARHIVSQIAPVPV